MMISDVVNRCAALAAGLAVAVLLGACAGSGAGKAAGKGAEKGKRSGEQVSAGLSTGSRGGAYYLDDGPGRSPPPDLDAIPDAVPRAEPLRAANSRPYVVFGREYRPMQRLEPYKERGVATWYGRRYHGNPTSSGERYDMYAMTAAHPTLPIPSYVRVTHLGNQRSVVVRVNDRGPFLNNRLIDLSYTAAARLGYAEAGTARVEVELITEFDAPTQAAPLVVAPPVVAQPAVPASSASTPLASAPPAPVPAETGSVEAPERLEVQTEILMADPVRPVATADRADRAEPSVPAPVQSSSRVQAREPVAGAPGSATPIQMLEQGYWLQLGAFGSADNADTARERLKAGMVGLGAPIDIVPDGGLFKLQAGPWPTREAAQAAAARVRAETGWQAFTTQR